MSSVSLVFRKRLLQCMRHSDTEKWEYAASVFIFLTKPSLGFAIHLVFVAIFQMWRRLRQSACFRFQYMVLMIWGWAGNPNSFIYEWWFWSQRNPQNLYFNQSYQQFSSQRNSVLKLCIETLDVRCIMEVAKPLRRMHLQGKESWLDGRRLSAF